MDRRKGLLIVTVVLGLGLVSCAAGDTRFTPEDPAGFWVGLWHGIISFITLVIGIFSDGVAVYERHNTGGWYDFGFLVGVSMMWGGSARGYRRASRRKRRERAWERFGEDIEKEIQAKVREWSEAEPGEDWDAVQAKAEAKLKRRIRTWLDEP